MPNTQAPVLNPSIISYIPSIPLNTTDPPRDIPLSDTITIQVQWKESSDNRIFAKVFWTSQPSTKPSIQKNKIGHAYNPDIQFSALGCMNRVQLAFFIYHEEVGRGRRRVFIEFARATNVDDNRKKNSGQFVKLEDLEEMDCVVEFKSFPTIGSGGGSGSLVKETRSGR